MSKKEWEMGQIFLAFSENLNFIPLCVKSGEQFGR